MFISHLFRDHFYQFGEIRSITMVPKQQCAFVCFTNRYSAETAAERSFNKLILKGRRLKILWGKSQGAKSAPGKEGGAKLTPVPGLPEGGWQLSLTIQLRFIKEQKTTEINMCYIVYQFENVFNKIYLTFFSITTTTFKSR